MKVTANQAAPPPEVKIILSDEETYALMAVIGRVSGKPTWCGKLTTRGHVSALYEQLRALGFDDDKKPRGIEGSLMYKAND